MGKTIGIDLGTTNSCFAVMEGGEPTVLENSEGGRTTPSVVAFTDSGERLVGTVAKRQSVMNPERTVYSIKRFMGRKEAEVKEEERIVPYDVTPGPNGDVRVDIGDKQYSPPEISAMILQKIKADAEAKLGESVDGAVITVPAYFNDDQRQATKDAGKIAGLDVKRIINEPTAASLAYGLDKEGTADQTILVFDLGGGTFDVSVLEIGDGVFEVKSTAGDNHLGGDNWDAAIVNWLVAEFKRDQGIDLAADKNSLQRLYEAAEKAKIELSTTQETQINLPFITAVDGQPKHLEIKLSRAKLDELTSDLLDRVVAPVKQALSDAGQDIDHVVMVGGMTRNPAVQEKVKELTGKEPAQGRQPGRGRRRRRRDPGGRARRRRQGRPAPRRHPADPRHRDQGRRDDEADRAQHDDPVEAVGDVLDRRRQPDPGRGPRAPGRAGDGERQQVARQVPAHRDPAGAARHAADRGHVRHRRQRHPQRLRQGPRDGQGADDRDQGRLRPLRRGGPEHGLRRRVARRGGPQGEGAGRGPQHRRGPRLPVREGAEGARGLDRRGDPDRDHGRDRGAEVGARLDRRRGAAVEDRGGRGGLPQGLRADLRQRPGSGSGRGRGREQPRRTAATPPSPRRRSSMPRSSRKSSGR